MSYPNRILHNAPVISPKSSKGEKQIKVSHFSAYPENLFGALFFVNMCWWCQKRRFLRFLQKADLGKIGIYLGKTGIYHGQNETYHGKIEIRLGRTGVYHGQNQHYLGWMGNDHGKIQMDLGKI